jgi:hypothetical protein
MAIIKFILIVIYLFLNSLLLIILSFTIMNVSSLIFTLAKNTEIEDNISIILSSLLVFACVESMKKQIDSDIA